MKQNVPDLLGLYHIGKVFPRGLMDLRTIGPRGKYAVF